MFWLLVVLWVVVSLRKKNTKSSVMMTPAQIVCLQRFVEETSVLGGGLPASGRATPTC